MADEQVTITALLTDKFTGPLKKIGRGLETLASVAKRVGRVIVAPFTLLGRVLKGVSRQLLSFRGLLLGGVGAAAVKVFADFQAGLAQVSTLIDTTVVDMERLRDGVLDLAEATGESFTSLNKSLFDTISAGVDAASALAVLEVATKLAAGGATTTAEATTGLVAIMNAYGLEASAITEISDALFQAMKGGITTIGQLSSAVGKVAPIARAAGVSIDEMLAAVSALTKAGISTDESVTALRALLQSFIKPTSDAQAAAREMGFELSTTAIRAKGLDVVMQELAEATGLNEQKMARLFPNVRALVGALNLAQDDAKNFTEILGTLADKTGATDEAFGKVVGTLKTRINILLRSIQRFAIEVVTAFEPILTEVIGDPEQGTGISGFFANLSKQKNTIQAIVDSTVEAFKRIAEFFKSAFSQGEFARIAVNAYVSFLQAAVQTLLAGLPLMLEVAKTVANQVASVLVTTFVGRAARELGRAIQRGGLTGAASAQLVKTLGLDPEEIAQVSKRIGELEVNLQFIDKRLENIRRRAAEDPQGVFSIPFGGRPGRTNEEELAATLERRRQVLTEFQSLMERGSQDIVQEAFKANIAGIAEEAKNFGTQAVPEILESVGQTFRTGFSNQTQAALDSLASLPADIRARIEDALLEDQKNLGKQAGKSFAEGFKEGKKEEDDKDPDPEESADLLAEVGSGLTGFIQQFASLETLGQAVGGALFNAVGGLIDVFTEGKQSFSEFARNFLRLIAKMILQMLIFRGLAAALGLAPVGAAKEGGVAELRKGGFIQRFSGGSEFVRGPAGIDRVPAMLTRGEAVIRQEAVAAYGRRFMSMINQGLFPVDVARQMSSNVAPMAAIAKRGFQTGGIPANVSPGAASGPVLPVMPVTEDAMEVLLNNDRAYGALLRKIRQNGDDLLAAVGNHTNKPPQA